MSGPRAASNVIWLGEYRGVFVLTLGNSIAVFLAARGSPPKEGHHRSFTNRATALAYADELVRRFDCPLFDPQADCAAGEDAA